MKKLIDREYPCTWMTEQAYLADHGIRYTFVKEENGVTVYKYKKTKKLFQTLSRLYEKLGILE